MKLLLDTHAFLWFIEGNQNLSLTAKNAIESPTNQRYLSIASLWEIAIKVSIGKLEIGMTLTELVNREVYGNAIEMLEIQSHHLDTLAGLPFHHKDPFDRLILSQGLTEKMPIVTKDGLFANYPVTLIW
ncbi:type II toxin-antitoxin system VapC family toxin [Pseudanabaena sp. UWO311]|uniref:type II toxin-antitoxin system VapC family toxin n=1 Tax=Pseudanabaena sp. UWO311 TaxID=2487337 RepID=UPI0011579568|nr:type II toxin-antitoxin system VapC family toxin [Pseudanabaena sp. UWO311]TYQ28691.1 type II toxin-antitoxin system VapC family toxin [Pseudanabaena sp. UWO311]